MGIAFTPLPEHRLVVAAQTGTTSDADLLASYEAFFGGPEFDPANDLLVDLRGADSSSRSTAALRRLVAILVPSLQGTSRRLQVAVVAPADLSFGLARMTRAFADELPWRFAVFRTLEEALAWLDRPPDLLDGGAPAAPAAGEGGPGGG
jgi:hypothetical protein